jgi:hypothetical protein
LVDGEDNCQSLRRAVGLFAIHGFSSQGDQEENVAAAGEARRNFGKLRGWFVGNNLLSDSGVMEPTIFARPVFSAAVSGKEVTRGFGRRAI